MSTTGAAPAQHRAWHAPVLLALIAAAAGGAVALVHELTAPRIAHSRHQALSERIASVLPAGAYDNDPLRDRITLDDPLLGKAPATVYRARSRGRPVAAVLRVSNERGYGGTLVLLVAVHADGRVAAVRALQHRETPGLGDAIEAARSPWIHGFDGASLSAPVAGRWAVRRDGGAFDQLTGATITARAAVGAVRDALLYFRANRARIFSLPE